MSLVPVHFVSWMLKSSKAAMPSGLVHDAQGVFGFTNLDPSVDYNVDWGDGSTDTVIYASPAPTLVEVTKYDLTTNVVTITANGHGFEVGNTVSLLGVDPLLDGTRTVVSKNTDTFTFALTHDDIPETACGGVVSLAVSTLVGSDVKTVTNKAVSNSNVATLTSKGHGFQVNDLVLVDLNDNAFDGTYTITAKTANTFSFALTHAEMAAQACTGTATNAIHTYATAGNYTVTVTDVTTAAVVSVSQVPVSGVVTPATMVADVPGDIVMTQFAANTVYGIAFGDGTTDTFLTDGSGEATVTHIYPTTSAVAAKTITVYTDVPDGLDITSGVAIGTAVPTVNAFVSVIDAFTGAGPTALDGKAFTGTGVGAWTAVNTPFQVHSNKLDGLANTGVGYVHGPATDFSVEAKFTTPADGVGIVAHWIDANNYVFFGERLDVDDDEWCAREVRTKNSTISNVALTNNIATVTAANHGYSVGDTIVVDASNNVFDGTYQVLQQHTKQTITIDASSGTFTVAFGGGAASSALAWNISANDLKTAINALEGVTGVGTVEVSLNAQVYTITFAGGSFANTSIPALTTDPGSLGGTGGHTAAVAITQYGCGPTANTVTYAKTNANVPSAAATGTIVGHTNTQTLVGMDALLTPDDTLRISVSNGVATFSVKPSGGAWASKGTLTLHSSFLPTISSGALHHGVINELGSTTAELDDFTVAKL